MSGITRDLAKLGGGERSALRRSAGTPMQKADIAALRAFYRACGNCDPNLEKYLFPAVCIDALWRDADEAAVKPMEECLRNLIAAEEEASAGIKRRIDALLEMPLDDEGVMPGKLLNLVRIIKNRTALKPDCVKLAEDLMNWDRPQRNVQRRWLRTIYNVKYDDNGEEPDDAD